MVQFHTPIHIPIPKRTHTKVFMFEQKAENTKQDGNQPKETLK